MLTAKIRSYLLAWVIMGMATLLAPLSLQAGTGQDSAEETMLMFIGQAQPVVTAASRYPESPETAPAMVTVISRDEIARHGYRTLAELLADQPGFFISAGGRGSVPHLRGLRDSVLFLYDGVPVTTDITKSFAPLDRQVSLSAVDRVEIVRGPGSVLWGPDAFAGVVNIVPLKGSTLSGADAGVIVGTDELRGAHFTWGQSGLRWDGSLNVAASEQEHYMPDFTDPSNRSQTLDASRYAEIVGTFQCDDWLKISGRWADYQRHYTMQNSSDRISWAGEKEAPFNYLKLTLSKLYGPSHYTLTGYVQQTDYSVIDADYERRQRNRVYNAELLWDRRFLRRGLVTAGASWRRSNVDGALVRDGFLPEFLTPDEPLFVPDFDQADYSNELLSAFAQLRYQWARSEWWAGLRLDDHSQYATTTSYSLGFLRAIGEHLQFKATFGTAFRSPWSSQLFDSLELEPESIRTTSAQMAWTPGRGHRLELTLYHSRIEDHRAEDPYGGLSLPAKREVFGGELAGRTRLTRSLSAEASFSWFDGSAGREQFKVLSFSFLRPDGSQVSVFDQWRQAVDQGPEWLARLSVDWRIAADHNVTVSARTGGDYDYSYEKGTVTGRNNVPLLLDLSYRRPGFFTDRDFFTLRITNLLDQDYEQTDLYGPADGPPLEASLLWQLRVW